MKKKWGDIADIVAFTNYVPWESSYDNEINEIKEPCSELWSRMFVWYDGKVNPGDFDYKSKLSIASGLFHLRIPPSPLLTIRDKQGGYS